MQRNLTKNKKCKYSKCPDRFDQKQFGQVCCNWECALGYAKEQEEKKANKRARNKRKDHPEVYYKENKKQLQDLVQHIARLIDKDCHCIDCDRTEAKPCWDGGHNHSKGAYPALRYNLHNIFRQTRGCNHQGQTSPEQFSRGIEKMYGKDYALFCDDLKVTYTKTGLTPQDYPEKITEALKIVRELKKLDKTYSPKQRIRLRTEINKRLGIYEN